MENAADALKMAAAILVFIIAIGSSFSLFGTAKQTADSIITMRDKQAYLDSAELDGGVLYTSSGAILGDTSGLTEEQIEALKKEVSSVSGLTKNGDRVVEIDDVISTILRYNKEKYGVTIIDSTTKEVLVRFDSNTENVMRQWYNISDGKDSEDNIVTADQQRKNYENKIKSNISTIYCKYDASNSNSIKMDLTELYEIDVPGNSQIKCGAPWYGNDEQIQKRIACDLAKDMTGREYTYNGQTYTGKNIITELTGKTIIEVTNEIDKSIYLKDGTEETNLLQQYEMPTVEIVYIIQ